MFLVLLSLNTPFAAQASASAQREALEAQAPMADSDVVLDGALAPYLQAALEDSPQLKAAYAAWDAEVRSIQGASTLPEPTLGFGIFLRSVETRVGPQQAKVSLQQSLPWPTELTGRHDAAVAQARVAQAQFDAVVLQVSAQVLQAKFADYLGASAPDLPAVCNELYNQLLFTPDYDIPAPPIGDCPNLFPASPGAMPPQLAQYYTFGSGNLLTWAEFTNIYICLLYTSPSPRDS